MISGIYQIHNQVDGKCYIGSSVNIRSRWRAHLTSLRHNRHHNAHLQVAFAEYGKEAFIFEILEKTDPENLLIREQHYLDMLKPEYNISPLAASCSVPQHPLEALHNDKMRALRLEFVASVVTGFSHK